MIARPSPNGVAKGTGRGQGTAIVIRTAGIGMAVEMTDGGTMKGIVAGTERGMTVGETGIATGDEERCSHALHL